MALAREAESLGLDAVRFSESVPGKEALSLAGVLLAATDRIAIATGIANAWARDPIAMENGARTLAEAYPGRFVLGIGVSHPETVGQRGHDYASPITFMRRYFDGMDAAAYEAASPKQAAPRIVAANGQKMLALSAERADGAFPAPVTDAFTAQVRSLLGPDRSLVVGKNLAPGVGAERARSAFAASLPFYNGLDIYRRHFVRLGWGENDLASGGSASLIDAIVTSGSDASIRTGVQAEFEAGADHVVASLVGVKPQPDGLRRLAEAVAGV